MTGGIKLEIGAGERPTPGFAHHDARALPDIEIVCDMWDLPERVADCAEVRATHLLEHFPDTARVLDLWVGLLRPGGALYIEVPNGEWQYAQAHAEVEFEEWVRLVFGEQDYPGNAHHTAFSASTLSRALMRAGLVGIEVRDVGWVLCARAETPVA